MSIAIAELREQSVGPSPGAGAAGSSGASDPAGPLHALAPLVAMRERLGARADGLLRRVLWRRLFGLFLACSVALELIGLATGLVAPF